MPPIPRSGLTAAALAAASVVGLMSAGVASAKETEMPFAQALRRCDFSENQYFGGGGYARAYAKLRTEGNDVVADVTFATGVPNTRYDVRIIQVPRSSAQGCNAGDPGVAEAALFTDNIGGGAVTLRGPLMPGATGAWMSVTRPGAFSQRPAEFYTTDNLAAL